MVSTTFADLTEANAKMAIQRDSYILGSSAAHKVGKVLCWLLVQKSHWLANVA